MRKHVVAALLLALCAIGLTAGAQQRPEEPIRLRDLPEVGAPVEIPKRIDFDEPQPYWIPIPWVTGSEVTDPSGFTINEDLLRYSVPGKWIDELVEAHETGIRFANDPSADPPPIVRFSLNPGMQATRPGGKVSSFQELIESSRFVAVGTVRESVGGFSYGDAGQMLLIRVDEWHGPSEEPHPDEVLLFWPGGEVEVGYATILATMDGVPMPPKVGEMVVLFPEVGRSGDYPFISFLRQRYSHLGAAAKFGPDGNMQVSQYMAQQIPSVARMGSFAAFAAQLEVAIARSAIR